MVDLGIAQAGRTGDDHERAVKKESERAGQGDDSQRARTATVPNSARQVSEANFRHFIPHRRSRAIGSTTGAIGIWSRCRVCSVCRVISEEFTATARRWCERCVRFLRCVLCRHLGHL